MTKRKEIIGILGLALVVTTYGKEARADCTAPSGYTCVCNSGETKWVCAKWSQGALPVVPDDFAVNYGCYGCADAPNIELRHGDAGWELYSEVKSSSTPANLGSITVPSGTSGDFGVKIAKGASAGAVNVGTSSNGINLTLPSSSNYSNLTGANLTGTLSGLTNLQKSSGGTGGDLTGAVTVNTISGTVLVAGNALAPMTVTNVNSGAYAQLNGNLGTSTQSANLSIGTLAATFNVNGSGTHYSDITVTTMSTSGGLTVWGTIPSGKSVTVGNFSGAGNLSLSGTLTGTLELSKSL